MYADYIVYTVSNLVKRRLQGVCACLSGTIVLLLLPLPCCSPTSSPTIA